MDDEFEIVDNEKSGFDELDDDDGLLNDDDLGTISDLNKEMKEVQELKKYLKSQSIESSKVLKKLAEQSAASDELQAQLKRELDAVKALRASMQAEQAEVKAQKEELAQLLGQMTGVPAACKKSQSLLESLNKLYSDSSSLEEEVQKLKDLRGAQEEMINACKVHIETLNSNQRDCVMSLDKSKSFSCKECGTDIALKEDIESKCYQVGQGQFTEKKRGYLFSNAVNVLLGATKTENFTTGSYQISWASCAKCRAQLGWKYISADNPTNKAKVGKFCLARYSLSSPEDRAQQK